MRRGGGLNYAYMSSKVARDVQRNGPFKLKNPKLRNSVWSYVDNCINPTGVTNTQHHNADRQISYMSQLVKANYSGGHISSTV